MVQAPKDEMTRTEEERRRMTVPCEDWSRILRWYRSAVKIYSHAVDALGVAGIPGFNEAWEVSEEARTACGEFRAALLEHEHRHGCHVAPGLVQETRSAARPYLRAQRTTPVLAVGDK
jgi:hypothetical protein